MNEMNIICIDEEAFFALLDRAYQRLENNKNPVKKDKWISPKEAKRILGIKSNTTLKKYRDEGKIRFSQDKENIKLIQYDPESIYQYLEKHAKNTF